MDGINQFESNILVWIQENVRISAGDAVMPWISALNNIGMLSIATVIVLLLWRRYRTVGVTAFFSLLTTFVLVNVVIKPLVSRTRPYFVSEILIPLGRIPKDFSFPSGHSGASFAVAIVMLLCMPKKYGVTATVIASLIALSRLYNGMHYPTDVLGGIFIGTITSLIASKTVFPWICRKLDTAKE